MRVATGKGGGGGHDRQYKLGKDRAPIGHAYTV